MHNKKIKAIIKIQSVIRGFLYRLKKLPLSLYLIKEYLVKKNIKCENKLEDGRINSVLDEEIIINLLKEKFNKIIKIPKIRMWYDLLIYDTLIGWYPINIKTTTMKMCDNTGNLAMCVYAYTDFKIDLNENYQNGEMSKILVKKLKNNEYNKNTKRDYYFLVINKCDTKEIIINSVKGLSNLTSNINNLPFQICWKNNKIYNYDAINKKVKIFINCLKKPKPSWKETFMNNIRLL